MFKYHAGSGQAGDDGEGGAVVHVRGAPAGTVCGSSSSCGGRGQVVPDDVPEQLMA